MHILRTFNVTGGPVAGIGLIKSIIFYYKWENNPVNKNTKL